MTTLLLLAHADPTATPPFYARALEGRDVEFRPFVSHFPGLSSAYAALAAHLRAPGGRILPGLLGYAGASKPLGDYARVVLASWSAGYKLAEALLEVPADRDALAGWVALDSGYGTAPAGVVDLAQLARDARKLFFAGCTDIRTEPAYPSSRAFLDEVQRRGGAPGGLFRVEHWGGTTAADHVRALREHGPELVAAALDALEVPAHVAPSGPPTDPSPGPIAPRQSFGERLVNWYRAELAAGVHETPSGSNTGPRIREYLAICRRRGTEKPLRLTAAPWCAAMFSFGCDRVAAPGEAYPAPRAAGIELEQDAQHVGSWHGVDEVLAGTWTPAVGDAVICQRGDGWTRHVCVLAAPIGADHVAHTLGGNEGDAIRETVRPLRDGGEPIRGFIALPRT